MQLKNYKKAILDFNHVLAKKPYMSEVKLQRGMAYYHLNRLYESEQDLVAVVNSNPSKSREAIIYLENIQKEKELAYIQNQEQLNYLRLQVENERLQRARHREEVIWNTVVPLAFWTTVFLTW
jgi:tetratricopeptide (TPR) repeat protein